jgi:hypothetical protein
MATNTPNTLLDFYDKIIITEYCWIFTSKPSHAGYPRFAYKGTYYNAHQFSYLIYRDDLIKGLIIDHLCYNKTCVNPKHLEQVTYSENSRRSHIYYGTSSPILIKPPKVSLNSPKLLKQIQSDCFLYV